ncbi:TPA: AAA family ATPase [Salmonella enterica]|uniref:AAA family ATPase n=1 Tax=Salmonella enterica TaxID=28901 RepID=A0A743PK58_SALER|nr:AAA family ATPase [Salmonella enterica]
MTKVATQILSIISTKGGEGKSTQGAYLAGFTADAGLKTLLIDGDYSQPTSNENTTERGVAELILGKQRQGPLGTVKTRYEGEYTRFSEYHLGYEGQTV